MGLAAAKYYVKWGLFFASATAIFAAIIDTYVDFLKRPGELVQKILMNLW